VTSKVPASGASLLSPTNTSIWPGSTTRLPISISNRYRYTMWPVLGLFAALSFLAGALHCLKYLNQRRYENRKQEQLIEQVPIKRQVDISRNIKKARQPLNFFLILDVEATCVPGTDFAWPNEIIEWPVILLTWEDRDAEGLASKLKAVDEFRSFVKPTWRPKLSEFCSSLTGITQKDVDSAFTFPVVLEKFHEFLCDHGLLCRQTGRRLQKFTWATDGPCDIRDFVVKQCFISKMEVPDYLKGDVIDVRKLVATWLSASKDKSIKNLSKWSPTRNLNISRQLAVLSLPSFQGRQHSGIDDSRNIARILAELARRGVRLENNLRIQPGRRWYWMGDAGEIIESYFP